MMSSGRSGQSGMRVPRRPTKNKGTGQYVMLAVVAVLVIIIVLVVAFGGKKSTTAKTSRQLRGQQTELAKSARGVSPGERKKEGVRSTRREKKKRELASVRREQRRRERSERTKTTRVSARSSRGGYTVKRGGSPVLQAIISRPDGERIAVVGNRQIKKGDQFEGRRITEIGPDRIKVEYFTKTYEVRLNQPIY
uniref:Uncharacterized protein n=1 Tax=candidate division WOR-3 bacterium TaxID=2052148 RepID=A0A7V3PSQ2_UNCW3